MENSTPPLDHYAALNISHNATEAEIIKAARKRRIETHPDKFAGKFYTQKEADAINTRAQNVGLAADVLCDATARRRYDGEMAQWKAWQARPRPAEEPVKEPDRTRHATPTASNKSDHRHEARPSNKPKERHEAPPSNKPDHRKEAPPKRAPSQSSGWGERAKESGFFNRHKAETRGRSAAEADEASHAPKPSSSTPPRSDAPRQERDAPRRQEEDNYRQDRDARRQDRGSYRQDRNAPRQHRDSYPQDRDPSQRDRDYYRQGRDIPRQDRDTHRKDHESSPRVPAADRQGRDSNAGQTKPNLVGSLHFKDNSCQTKRTLVGSLKVPERAGSERKSSRHDVEKKVRFEHNVRFKRERKEYDD